MTKEEVLLSIFAINIMVAMMFYFNNVALNFFKLFIVIKFLFVVLQRVQYQLEKRSEENEVDLQVRLDSREQDAGGMI